MSGPGRRLLLLRHAKAVAARPGMSDAFDHARALSEQGRDQAAALGALLRGRGLTPDLALVSTSRRTRETFNLLGIAGPSSRCLHAEAIYLAGTTALLDLLREQHAAARTVLLVGHNPGVHRLALDFAGARAALASGFPPCTLALFAIEGEWSALAPAAASLLEILHP